MSTCKKLAELIMVLPHSRLPYSYLKKKNEEDLYKLMGRDFQNMSLSGKNIVQRVYVECNLLYKRKGKYVCICLFLQKEIGRMKLFTYRGWVGRREKG